MAVGLTQPKQLLPIAGIRLATAAAGVRYPDRKDVLLIELSETTTAAAVFTKNAFCAAPVTLAKSHLSDCPPRLLLINSGNANAGTGEAGMRAAKQNCIDFAAAMNLPAASVLPFSTGVIGEQLPAQKISACAKQLVSDLQEDHWLTAAEAIMTTDTLPKGLSRTIDFNGQLVTITGICKGSGMICPDMATLLSYVATDAVVDQGVLQQALEKTIADSFNSITVDGDTSTNDACVLVASGASGVVIDDDNGDQFIAMLAEVMQALAQSIIRDAEGATKFIAVEVNGAMTHRDAKEVAYTVAHSPLVKTAFFASDPNWGRILAAVGRARVSNLDVDQISLHLNDLAIVEGGQPDRAYSEDAGQAEMNKDDITIRVELNQGQSNATVWTSDLSHDYVQINSDYRS